MTFRCCARNLAFDRIQVRNLSKTCSGPTRSTKGWSQCALGWGPPPELGITVGSTAWQRLKTSGLVGHVGLRIDWNNAAGGALANSALYSLGVGKQRPASAKKAKTGIKWGKAVPDLSTWRPWAGLLSEAPTHPQMLWFTCTYYCINTKYIYIFVEAP